MNPTWLPWVQLINIPILLALLRLVWTTRHELAEFKLEVAKEYTSIAYLKDVEKRLLAQLEKIEGKLDQAIRDSSRRSSK